MTIIKHIRRGVWGLLFTISPILWADNPTSLNSLLIPETESSESLYASAHYTFRGSVARSINFVQLCVATNDTCDTCLPAPYTTIMSGTPIPYSTLGTTYGISPESIGASLSSSLFAPGIYNIRLSVQSTASQCTSNTRYCSANKNELSEFLCLLADFDGSAVTFLTPTTANTQVPLDEPKIAFGYVVEDVVGLVQKCSIDTGTGDLTGCATAEAGQTLPSGITVTTLDGVQYAYVVNQALIGIGIIQVCPITPGTGDLSTCAIAFSIDVSNTPHRLAFSTINGITYAYISTVATLQKCVVNTSNGIFSGCGVEVNYPSSLLRSAVTTVKVGGTTYLYYTTSTTANKCTLDSSGSVVSCALTPAVQPAWTLSGITITYVDNLPYAYLSANPGGAPTSNLVYVCSVSTINGDLSGCTPANTPGTPAWQPSNVTFQTVNGTQYAYVSDVVGGIVYKCNINADGTFNSCAQTPAGVPFPVVTDMAFAYV